MVKWSRGLQGLLSILSVVVSSAAPAAAEPFFDAFTGKSFTANSDVGIKQGGSGNDFVVHDVSFDDKSFSDPPYYGLRAGYFFESLPWLGVGLEFFHFKVFADTTETKAVTGTRQGAPIDTVTRVDSIVQQFDISHGVNYLLVDGLVRYPLVKDPEQFPGGRVHLYGGLGVGPVIAHAENRVDGVGNDQGYEVAGAGLQVFVGVRVLLTRYFGLFAEYKFTHSDLTVGVAGGEGSMTDNTHHLVGGITLRLPSF